MDKPFIGKCSLILMWSNVFEMKHVNANGFLSVPWVSARLKNERTKG